MSTPSNGRDHHFREVAAYIRATRPSICVYCNRKIDPRTPHNSPGGWTLDHVVALADGGDPLDPNNLVVACRSCNSRRSAERTNNMKRGRNSRTW